MKCKNRKIWYYCDPRPNLHSLNHIKIFLFVNPFIEGGPALKMSEINFLQPALLPVSKFLL